MFDTFLKRRFSSYIQHSKPLIYFLYTSFLNSRTATRTNDWYNAKYLDMVDADKIIQEH